MPSSSPSPPWTCFCCSRSPPASPPCLPPLRGWDLGNFHKHLSYVAGEKPSSDRVRFFLFFVCPFPRPPPAPLSSSFSARMSDQHTEHLCHFEAEPNRVRGAFHPPLLQIPSLKCHVEHCWAPALCSLQLKKTSSLKKKILCAGRCCWTSFFYLGNVPPPPSSQAFPSHISDIPRSRVIALIRALEVDSPGFTVSRKWHYLFQVFPRVV